MYSRLLYVYFTVHHRKCQEMIVCNHNLPVFLIKIRHNMANTRYKQAIISYNNLIHYYEVAL